MVSVASAEEVVAVVDASAVECILLLRNVAECRKEVRDPFPWKDAEDEKACAVVDTNAATVNAYAIFSFMLWLEIDLFSCNLWDESGFEN